MIEGKVQGCPNRRRRWPTYLDVEMDQLLPHVRRPFALAILSVSHFMLGTVGVSGIEAPRAPDVTASCCYTDAG